MADDRKSQDEYFLAMGEQHMLTSSCWAADSLTSEFWYRSCSRRSWFWRFHFVRRFWYLLMRKILVFFNVNLSGGEESYHVFTCVSDRFSWLATSARSATDKYFWHRNFRSRKASCECVNAVRRRRFRFKLPLLPSRLENGWVSCMFE